MKRLTISLSPHVHSGMTIDKLMWQVVIAMLPALIVAVWTFGLPALWTVLISVAACVATEWVIEKYCFHNHSTIGNGSAIVTGILLGFNVPSILPWWMTIIGAIVAIGIGKMSFGGLGRNIWNPALVGRVFLLLSFPAAMTTWPTGVASGLHAVSGASAHASTGATMLATLNNGGLACEHVDMLGMMIGQMNGSLGEVGSLAIILGGLYLLFAKVITWHVPVSVLGSAALFSWIFGGNPLLDLFAGGLMLGAVFMATDYVTSPMTGRGKLIFGFMIGFITIIIRRFGAYPEGVSFAILLMNSFVPLINRYCRPGRFGERRAKA